MVVLTSVKKQKKHLQQWSWRVKMPVCSPISHYVQQRMLGLTNKHRRRIMRDCRRPWTASCRFGKWPRYKIEGVEVWGGVTFKSHGFKDIKVVVFSLFKISHVLKWWALLVCCLLTSVLFYYLLWLSCLGNTMYNCFKKFPETAVSHISVFVCVQGSYLEIKKQMDKLDPLAHPLLQW